MPSSLSLTQKQKVAVIGAGPSGLIAARELQREGHSVVVFEKQNQVGGTWNYDPTVEPDPLGIDPTRSIVHSSLYSSLRINLPRETMGFFDYPFVPRPGESRDPRRYPGHKELLTYLEEFAREFSVDEMVRFETEVVYVGLVEEAAEEAVPEKGCRKWRVRSREKKTDAGKFVDEIYDAVVVCNGHFTQPRLADIPGIESWPGKQMHSHNYRVRDPFEGLVVIVIGGMTSAIDISRDIAKVAKEVHIASRLVEDQTNEKQSSYDNLCLNSMIENAREDGSIVFRNGKVVFADYIIHCTGYMYHFPFLDTNGIVTVDDNRVGPLYKHIFPPLLAPSISFVGLPFQVCTFPMFELQSKWIAGTLSGRVALPSREEMIEDVENFYSKLETNGCPKRYTHCLDNNSQFEYFDFLAERVGCPSIEEWRKKMFSCALINMKGRIDTYRDLWKDYDLISQAYNDFGQYV